RVGHIERNGINPITLPMRHGTLGNIGSVWFAGNLSFTYLVIGAAVWSYGLSLAQGVLAIVIGLLSFILIGYLGLPGYASGLPTMAWSRSLFGTRGNVVVSLMAWLNMVGWETVVLIISTYAVQTILVRMGHVAITPFSTLLSLALVAAAELSIALLGHATIERVQTIFSYVFGILTLAVLLAFLPHVHWDVLWQHPGGSWWSGMVPAVTIVVAVSALSWITTASDYTRYLPGGLAPRRLVSTAAWGSFAPTFLLMIGGLLLASTLPSLADVINPVGILLHWLPAWAAIPYLVITIGGMIGGGILCAYSAGLSLLAAGVKVPRYRTIFIDGVVSLAAGSYILLDAHHFIDSFEAFLEIVGAFLAPWAAIAIMNVSRTLKGSQPRSTAWWAMVSWLAGVLTALLTTATSIFQGPWAVGIFAQSSLGYFLGFGVTFFLYGLGPRRRRVYAR
ncbi:MAG: cytosine permease, partial [Firmicutes bacterium]|nr:cytosine permease [Bacillota bacterium]